MAVATNVTSSLVLVLCDRDEGNTNVTHSLAIAVADKDVGYVRTTQENILVLCNQTTQKVRVTSTPLLVVGVETATAGRANVRVTQSLVLLVVGGGGGCPDLLGTWSLSFPQLIERTLRLLGEDVDTPTYWSEATIGRHVNDAYIAICRDTKVLEFIEEITAVADTAEYGLTDNLLQVKRVFVNGFGIPNKTKLELDRFEPGWESRTRKARGYVTTQHDNRRMSLDAIPTAGDEIDVWAVRLPDRMSDDCDTPEIPEWSHPAIPFMAAARALDTYGEHGNRELSAAYSSIAVDYMTALRSLVGHRVGER